VHGDLARLTGPGERRGLAEEIDHGDVVADTGDEARDRLTNGEGLPTHRGREEALERERVPLGLVVGGRAGLTLALATLLLFAATPLALLAFAFGRRLGARGGGRLRRSGGGFCARLRCVCRWRIRCGLRCVCRWRVRSRFGNGLGRRLRSR